MKRPIHCPHCREEVDEMDRYKWHAPPDERDDTPMPLSMGSSDDAPSHSVPVDDVIDCYLMKPCGHVFREEDIEDPPVDLRDRVLNPTSPVDYDE